VGCGSNTTAGDGNEGYIEENANAITWGSDLRMENQ